ncbi:toxin VasX [Pseudomonas sp. NPDC087598]|uniref:toxin VasX n=1 Tax=Pseudomonas sp. NPDC087598 TaxID=3364440 RepID=UPI0038139BFB
MADKSGTLQQQRNACFPTTTAKATGGCPLTGPDVAIVPMRYALDRSRYDEDPKKLKPLLKSGKWAALPDLKTRSYTLRQLYDGYVYVYDETAKTFHEYEFSAANSSLTRVQLTEAETGKDERKASGAGKNYLIYPRKNQLRIAYSPKQWTWRTCEHMRSNPGSRKQWMKALDLPSYCINMSTAETLPLLSIAEAAADVDKGAVISDKRLADSAIPPYATDGKANGKRIFSTLAADVHWTGSVPDKESALIIALDDPLAVLNDLGMQLAADQVAYESWQQQHEHKIQIAQTVEILCGANVAPDNLPVSIRGDAAKIRQYQRDLDAYYTQRENEKTQAVLSAMGGRSTAITLPSSFKSLEMAKTIKIKYGTTPTEADYQAWSERAKWRREINLDGAHAYIQSHQQNGETLLNNVHQTQHDFQAWSKHIGIDPLRLFIDTTSTKQLHYLQATMASLLSIYCQNKNSSDWLAKEDIRAESLFGTIRYGFSPALKDALDTQANLLLNGIGDMTTLATRVGELNGVLNQDDFVEKPWMKALKKPVQDTFLAMRELATREGKATAETILMALIPSDSRMAMGKNQNISALIRNFLIGQVLSNSPDRPAIDSKVSEKLKTWKNQWLLLNKQIADTRKQWIYPDRAGQRKSLARTLQMQEAKLQMHELKMPGVLDYQNNKYAELLREEIKTFASSRIDIAKNWNTRAKAWSEKWGLNAGPIVLGVIAINFINTALTYRDLTKDGQFSNKDIAKVSYGLGYSFNLLMAVFVETPWKIIKNAVPVLIDEVEIGILNQSAAFWTTEGKTVWASAIRAFGRRMVAMGAFAVISTVLEIWDIQDDYGNARSPAEKAAMWVKGFAVFGMGVAGIAQLLTGVTLAGDLVVLVMNPWFAVAMLVLGAVYLAATLALNYFKSDGVGWWLRKCCWSHSKDMQYKDTLEGQAEEKRDLLEIQLSPQVYVKGTFITKRVFRGRLGYQNEETLNGAWVHLRLPSAVRGQLVQFNVIDSKRLLPMMPVRRMDDPVQDPFLDKGQFADVSTFGVEVDSKPSSTRYPVMPASIEDIVWRTWIPVDKSADFIELQIWYPTQILAAGTEDNGYLYQLELDKSGNSSIDGLSVTELQVKSSSRTGAMILAVAE